MATIATAIQKIWIEDFAPGVRTALLELDKTFANFRDTSMGVRSENMGRDWKVKHTFLTSLAGKLRAYTNMGESDIYGAGTDPVIRVNGATPATWPGLDGQPLPGYVQREISLKRWKGNTFIPSQYLRADQLDSVIADAVANIIKQTALMVATWKANCFFSADKYHALGTVGVVDSGGGTGTHTVTITIDTNNRIRKFQPGLEVDIIYDNSGVTKRNTNGTLVVTTVDPISNQVTIAHAKGSGTNFGSQVAATDVIVLTDSVTGTWASPTVGGPSRFDEFFVNSGTLFGGTIDLAVYPQFKSIIVSNLGSALTEADLRKYVGAYLDIFGPSKAPDTLLTTQGVLNAYVAETDDMWMYGIQGQPLRKEGGFELGSYDYDGKRLAWKVSPLVEKGRLYGVRMANNFRRYVPPRLPKAGGNKFFNQDIEFLAPLGGLNGIWMFVTYNNSITDWTQAPFECCEEYAPEILQGVKISGITEEYATS